MICNSHVHDSRLTTSVRVIFPRSSSESKVNFVRNSSLEMKMTQIPLTISIVWRAFWLPSISLKKFYSRKMDLFSSPGTISSQSWPSTLKENAEMWLSHMLATDRHGEASPRLWEMKIIIVFRERDSVFWPWPSFLTTYTSRGSFPRPILRDRFDIILRRLFERGGFLRATFSVKPSKLFMCHFLRGSWLLK